ncbi:MAG: class I SAM-dependent methyltransferase [Planctomycetota bacterium]|jgi:cyclopropane-fatty-acyl-phospholipid synthase
MSQDEATLPLKAALGTDRRARRRSLSERLVHLAASRIARGTLTIIAEGRVTRFGVPEEGGLAAEIRVRDRRFFAEVATGGVVAVGDTYRDGLWETPDLVALIRLLVRNRDALASVDGRLARLVRPLRRLAHRARRNTVSGSRRNIAAHYDLSNEFFELLLDETMTYSAAVYEHPEQSLADAQRAKLDRLFRKLDLGPGDHLLEIGTGWGALSIRAASEFGCRVTTTTISKEQHAFARRRIDEAGLADRIDLRLQDYRDLEGTYDKIVSVEMIEAVGHEYYRDFFTQCARLGAPDALFAMQAITISDQHYERSRRNVDYIKARVFPGSNIPSIGALIGAATRGSDWRLRHLDDITPHYCRTLAEWRTNLHEASAEVDALGLDASFRRAWEFYLAYCEGGFAERFISTAQLVFSRSDWRGEAPGVPRIKGKRRI